MVHNGAVVLAQALAYEGARMFGGTDVPRCRPAVLWGLQGAVARFRAEDHAPVFSLAMAGDARMRVSWRGQFVHIGWRG